MREALVGGKLLSASKVKRGTIGLDPNDNKTKVVACLGALRSYYRRIKRQAYYGDIENETEWHSSLKKMVDESYVEVICGDNGEHRADILTPHRAIELQNSSISYYKIDERTKFYKQLTGTRLIWIVNCFKSYARGDIAEWPYGSRNQFIISWKRPKLSFRKAISDGLADFYLDISRDADYLLHVWEYNSCLYGSQIKKEKFFGEYLYEYRNIDDDHYYRDWIGI